MWNQIKKNLIGPMIGRAGAVFTTYLITVGVGESTAAQIAGGAVAALLLGTDLMYEFYIRRGAKK